MPRTALDKLVPKADYHLIRSFPKVAQRLESELHTLDRSEMDAYLKLLPGAIERFQGAVTKTNDLHESVEVAINSLIASFGSRNAAAVEPMPLESTSNTASELEETAGDVSEPGRPNDPGTGREGGIQAPDEAEGELPGSEGG